MLNQLNEGTSPRDREREKWMEDMSSGLQNMEYEEISKLLEKR